MAENLLPQLPVNPSIYQPFVTPLSASVKFRQEYFLCDQEISHLLFPHHRQYLNFLYKALKCTFDSILFESFDPDSALIMA